jgi:hypothetical protein
MYNPFAAEKEAPVKLALELWPGRLKARATLTQDGKERDIEVSMPVAAAIISFVKPYLK